MPMALNKAQWGKQFLVKLLSNFHLKIVEVPTQQDGQTTPTEFRIACINLE
jgi:hypothetical protein